MATVPVGAPPLATFQQEPLRIGLGLVAFVFYLWITHSYKLNAGDLAVLGLGLGVLLRGKTLRMPAPLKFFGAFILWSSLGLAVTTSNPITLASLIDLTKIWTISFFVVNLIRTPAELRFIIIAWLGVYALYPIRGALYNQYICQCNEFGRVSWNFVFSNPNDLAAFSLIPLGLAAAVAIVERVGFWRLCGIVGVAVVSLVIMLTQSRGAMLAIGSGVMITFLASRRKGRDLLLLTMLLGAAVLASPKGVWNRLAGLANVSVTSGMQGVDPEGSAQVRWEIWKVAYATILKHPVTGVGAGMMPATHRLEVLRREGNRDTFLSRAKDTHSTYLRTAAETGVPGLILFLSMWGSVLLYLQKVRRKLKDVRPKESQALLFIQGSMIAYLVASVFGSYEWLSFTYLGVSIAWLCAATLEDAPWYVPARALPATVTNQSSIPGRRPA